MYFSFHFDRKSLEFEDIPGSNSSFFTRSLSQEHHYEDILGQKPLYFLYFLCRLIQFKLRRSCFSRNSLIFWKMLSCHIIWHKKEHVLKVAIFGLPADSSKENPYEDIELESQCSQQSLPSSPGADTTKVPTVQTHFTETKLLI